MYGNMRVCVCVCVCVFGFVFVSKEDKQKIVNRRRKHAPVGLVLVLGPGFWVPTPGWRFDPGQTIHLGDTEHRV